MNNAIVPHHGIKTMSSLEMVDVINSVRKEEGKKPLLHKNFIQKLEKHPGIDSANLIAQYKDVTGRMLKCYNLPKREAELMAMSESMAIQAKVYDRMTELESASIPAPADPFAHIPPHHRALVELMCENANLKAAQEAQAAIQIAQAESIHRIEVKQCAYEEGHSFFTGLAFCAMRGVKLVMSDMQRLGRLAAAHSKANNIPIDKTRDARFGMVNQYHETALEAAFAEIHGGM